MARRFSPVVVIVYLCLFVSVFWRILREFASRREEARKNQLLLTQTSPKYSTISHWSSLRKDTSTNAASSPRRFPLLSSSESLTGASSSSSLQTSTTTKSQALLPKRVTPPTLYNTETNQQQEESQQLRRFSKHRILRQVPVKSWKDSSCAQKSNSAIQDWVQNARNAFVDPKCNPGISSYILESDLIESRRGGGIGQQPCDRYIWHGRSMYSGIWDTFPCSFLNITYEEVDSDKIDEAVLEEDEDDEEEGDEEDVNEGDVDHKLLPLTTTMASKTSNKLVLPRLTESNDFFVVVVVTDKTFKRSFDAAETWIRRMNRKTNVRPLFITKEEHLVEAEEVLITTIRSVGKIRSVTSLEMKKMGGSSTLDSSKSKRALDEEWVLVALKIASLERPKSSRWTVFLTDSTWLSLEEASTWLAHYEFHQPLVIGHIESGMLVDTPKTRQLTVPASGLALLATYPAGSAGVIFSSSALTKIGNAILSPSCPWPDEKHVSAHRWDVLLGRCAFTLLIPQLFSPNMVPSMDSELGKSLHMDNNPTSVEAIITVCPYDQYTYERYHDRFNGAAPDTFETILNAIRFKDNAPEEFLRQKGD
jgi:hypothetical protein